MIFGFIPHFCWYCHYCDVSYSVDIAGILHEHELIAQHGTVAGKSQV